MSSSSKTTWSLRPEEPDVDLPDYGGEVVVNPENEGRVPTYETDDWQRVEGRRKRERILNELFPLIDYL